MNTTVYASLRNGVSTLIFPQDAQCRVLIAHKRNGVWSAIEKVAQSHSPARIVDVSDMQRELDAVFSKSAA